MPRRLAYFISIIFHPLLMPFYAVSSLFFFNSYMQMIIPEKLRWILLALLFLTTAFMPFLSAIIMKRKGEISTLEMESREERQRPLFTVLMYYLITIYFVHRIHLPLVFTKVLAGAAIVVAFVWIINYFTKISLHTSAAGGFVGFVFTLPYLLNGYFFYPLVASLLLAGVIGSARLVAGNHTLSQIYSGYGLGFVVMTAVMLFPFYTKSS